VFILYFYLPIFVLMENISYMSFLGEGHVVLNSKKLYKPIFWLFGGSSYSSLTHSFFIVHCSHLSLCSLSIHSFTHSSFSFIFLGLGKKNELLERSHGFVGSNDYWCIPAMN
jgi:hypothetical protein